MTVPALVDTWYTRSEIPCPVTTDLQAVQRSWLWMFKAALTGDLVGGIASGTRSGGSLWTVEGSSDGVTAGMDATDRWGSTFTASKLVRATEGTAHSWIVLKSPTALGLRLLINYNGSSEGQAAFTCAPGAYSGGSVTAKPTATNETSFGTSSLTSGFNQMGAENTFGVNYRFGYSVNGQGEIHAWINRVTAGLFCGYVQVLQLRGQNVSDGWKWLGAAHFSSSGRGAGSTLSSMYSTGAVALRTPTLTARVALGGVTTGFAFGGTTFDGNFALDSLSANNIVLPVWVASNDSGLAAWRGNLQDVWQVGAPAVGASYPTVGGQTQQVVGNLLVPSGVPCAL